jgi:hypothetical protein
MLSLPLEGRAGRPLAFQQEPYASRKHFTYLNHLQGHSSFGAFVFREAVSRNGAASR